MTTPRERLAAIIYKQTCSDEGWLDAYDLADEIIQAGWTPPIEGRPNTTREN